ncbi:MAG: MMPL family transporter, partial [Catenulispora sp.]
MPPTKKILLTIAARWRLRAPAWLLLAGPVLGVPLIGDGLVRAAPPALTAMTALMAYTASLAGSSAALWGAVGGLCSVTGLAFLVLAGLGTRRRTVVAEVTYEQLTAGMVALLQARYVRGELTLAEYEAGLSHALPPTHRLAGARGPLRLTRLPDAALRAIAGTSGALLLVAGLAVLLILLVVYRSPVLPVFVLLTAGFALSLASGVVYLLASHGIVTLDGQGQGILSILVVGAATDYALLLVARYREELRRHDDRYEAMALAWRRTLEPVAASAATVVLGVLCLLLSGLNSNRGLGPVAAVGI